MLVVILISTIETRAFTNTNIKTINTKHRHRSNTNIALFVEPEIIAGAVVAAGGAILWLSGAEVRENKAKYAEWEAKELKYQEERRKLAYIEPRDVWKEEELTPYDGSDDTGPILLAVKGDVFNVWKGRNFYGKGAEYEIMSGRDATRFLAKNKLDEESDEERSVELNIGERANLEAWYWIIKNKYQYVGRLDAYDPKSTDLKNAKEGDAQQSQFPDGENPWDKF